MKKLINFTLIILCFIFIFGNNSIATTGTVTGNSLRLRENNDSNSEIITTMKKNEKVEIIDEDEQWYKVKFENYTGFASKQYIKKDEEENITPKDVNNDNSENKIEQETTTNNNEDETKVVEENIIGKEFTVDSDLSVRLKPNFSSIILNTITAKTKFIITDELGKWVEVSSGDICGWICKNKIQKEEINNSTEQINNSIEETNENNEQKNNPTSNELTANKDENSGTTNIPVEEEKPVEENNINKSGYINSETVNLRKGPSTTSESIELLDLNFEVEILAEEGDWYKVNTKYGEGYVAKRLISFTKVSSRGKNGIRQDTENQDTVSQEANEALTEVLNNEKNFGNEVVEFAKQYLGYNYVHGGKQPDTGFDCSGFTKYVFSNFGIELGSTAASQISTGTEISRDALEPGDLLLFQDEGKTKVGHCGIYIGNNTFIHAANSKRGVVTDNLEGNSYYSSRFVSAQRF